MPKNLHSEHLHSSEKGAFWKQQKSPPGVLKRLYVYSSIIILLIFGAAKTIDVINGSQAINALDPVFGVPFGRLMLAAAISEISVALICINVKEDTGILYILTIASILASYRFTLWLLDWTQPCSCMGSLTDGLDISTDVANRISIGVLSYFIVLGYCIILFHSSERKKLPQGALIVTTSKN